MYNRDNDPIRMMNQAETLFNSGCNCAQSVFLACTDERGIDQDLAMKLASSFGGGMGRLREVCGALTGLFMAVGVQYGSDDPSDQEAKTLLYQLIQDLAGQFRREFGSLLCRDLLQLNEPVSDPTPELRTPDYYARRPCAEYVRFAAGLMDQLAQAPTSEINRIRLSHSQTTEEN
jgi:C_GCAxxG_C_C family probable redox protein